VLSLRLAFTSVGHQSRMLPRLLVLSFAAGIFSTGVLGGTIASIFSPPQLAPRIKRPSRRAPDTLYCTPLALFWRPKQDAAMILSIPAASTL